ncbi:MAG: GTPase [Planctomycetota bacterium]
MSGAAQERRPAAPRRREDPTGLAPLVERLEGWIARTRSYPAIEKDRVSLEDLLRQIKARQASLEQPLRILLLGGTGVGKSTLFNALGGADLAVAAPVRPTTRELTAYYHADNGSGALGTLESKARLEPHERELLRDKIVIDAPDFDSTAKENRRLLEEALDVTDLALCVVTAEKYLSSELFELLRRYRDGIEFVFVLNKLDRTQESDMIVADLARELEEHGISSQGRAPRILPVSALAVRKAQHEATEAGLSTLEGLTLGEDAGEWPALRALLERELDKVRIREIKAAKLADRVRGLLTRVEGCVPEDVPGRVERWRAAWTATLQDLSIDLSRAFFGAIHGDFELQSVLRYLFGTSFAGVFGVFMTLVYGARSLLLPGYGGARAFGRGDLDQLLEERLRGVEIATVERRIDDVLDRFDHEGRALGFRPPPRGEEHELGASSRFLRPAAPQDVSALVVAVRREASREFFAICEQSAGPDEAMARAGRIAWNVLPVLVLVLAAYAFVGSLFPSGISPAAIAASLQGTVPLLEGALISLLLVCLLQWPLAERLLNRRIETSLRLLEGVVERAVQDCLGQAIVQEPEQVLAGILERHREFERLREDAALLLRDETSQRLPRPRTEASAPPAPEEEAEDGADDEAAGPESERLRA